MKKFTLILAALILASAAASCGKSDPAETTGNETDAIETSTSETDVVETDAPETEDPWADTETVRNDTTAFALASLTTSIGLEIRENQLYITSLKTESGVEKVTSPTAYEMPSYYSFGSGSDKNFAWVYSGYTLYNDGEGGKGYTLLFEDAAASSTYKLTVVARPDMAGPFEFFAYLDNNADESMFFTPVDFFSVTVDGESAPTTWRFDKESGIAEGYTGHFSGTSYAGTGIYQTVLSDGVVETASNDLLVAWNENGDIPMMYVDYGTDGIYYALEWTNGSLTATGMADGGARLSVCLAEEDYFLTTVPAGTSLYMPSVYLGVYDGDVDMGSNVFKHWFLRYKAPDNMWEDENEPLVQQDIQCGIDVAKYGIQQIKWDYGWWSDEVTSSFYRTHEGSLEVKHSYYLSVMESVGASTLAEFVQKAKEAGVNVTMYVLLKDTELDQEGVPTSVGEYGHPEWFSNGYRVSGGKTADLGNEECVEFYKEYLYNFFSSTGINTWRTDFAPIASASDQENRHGAHEYDVQYWCTIGFRDLVDYLIDNIEGFRFEACSMGGSMKDFFTATKASVINCDDSGNFMSLHMSFYDSSYCIHPAQLFLPCNTLTYTPGYPDHVGIGDYAYGLRTLLTGGFLVCTGRAEGPTEEDFSYWEYYIANLYNNIVKPLIRYGDLYHILPRPDGVHWDGLEYIDADSENEIKGLVMLWKPTNEEGPEKTIFLRGLEADTLYQLTFEDRPEQNVQRTGADLMENGLTVVIEGESGSEMIWISEAE